MEHRHEINTSQSSKEIFFQDGLVEFEPPQIYSLEEEFAKAKKNHDLRPYFIFFGFIILLIAATIGAGHYLDAQSKQMKINISEFEDIRLKETLSTAKEKQVELGLKTQELDTKTSELKDKDSELKNKTKELKQLNASFETRIAEIKAEMQRQADLKNADQKALKRLQEQEKRQIEALKRDYETQTAKKQAEILRLQEQVKNITSYQYGLTFLLKERNATGCVIDPRLRKNIVLYFIKTPKLASESVCELYRGEAEYIGKIKLISDATGLRAEVFEVEKGKIIKPLDWFKLP